MFGRFKSIPTLLCDTVMLASDSTNSRSTTLNGHVDVRLEKLSAMLLLENVSSREVARYYCFPVSPHILTYWSRAY